MHWKFIKGLILVKNLINASIVTNSLPRLHIFLVVTEFILEKNLINVSNVTNHLLTLEIFNLIKDFV